MGYSREYEEKLLQLIWDNGFQEHQVLAHVLDWLSSDQTCEMLEDFCDDNDIDYEEEDDV